MDFFFYPFLSIAFECFPLSPKNLILLFYVFNEVIKKYFFSENSVLLKLQDSFGIYDEKLKEIIFFVTWCMIL